MADGRFPSWLWAARKGAISAFVVVHMGATALWVMPPCPLRAAAAPAVSRYVYPLGFWQYWGMFAPNPMRETAVLDAEVVDSRGIRATYPFTRVAEHSYLAAVPLFRHSKYAVNLYGDDAGIDRVLAARHAVRQLAVPDSAFPVDVTLQYQVRPSPPPGSVPDPMTATRTIAIETVHIGTPQEVRR